MIARFFCTAAIASFACAPSALAESTTKADSQPTIYAAQLHPMNASVTGVETAGEARFSIESDTLTITINAEKLPPNTIHLQHFHGFKDNRDATCPTGAADVNLDGIIDLIETEPTSGTTMVPFHDDPVSMEIVRDTYPKAGADGTFHASTIMAKHSEEYRPPDGAVPGHEELLRTLRPVGGSGAGSAPR